MESDTLATILTFKDLLLGEMNVHQWMFSLFLMTLGSLMWILFRIKNRKNKKEKFEFKIWFSDIDNLVAIPISLILTYLLIRFYSNYQQAIINTLPPGFEATPYFTMLLAGFGHHKIAEWIGKKAR